MNPVDLTTLKEMAHKDLQSGGRVCFTSEDDKLEARQTRGGIHKSELPSDQKSVLI